jgi:hypothetical protein
MEDAHPRIPKHFLLDGYYVYIYMHIDIFTYRGKRKERPRERGPIRWLQSGSSDAHSVGA